jgi:predicted ferric reductase
MRLSSAIGKMTQQLTFNIDPAQTKRAAILRIVIYFVLVTAPVLLTIWLQPREEHEMQSNVVEQLASVFGLLAFAIIALQFILSARIRWIEWPFGLDILYLFHKRMGIFAGMLLLTHPVLMAWGNKEWALVTAWAVEWPVQLGRLALLLVICTIVVSVFPKLVNLKFEAWRRLHNWLGLSVLALAFTHSVAIGGDLTTWPMRIYWAGLFAASVGGYGYHKFIAPRSLRRRPYEVAEIVEETHNVRTVKLQPATRDGASAFTYLPGQFHFLTFQGGHLPVEEHPFSISSSPTEQFLLASTIKESGDFTKELRRARVGDLVMIRGAFGRFSHRLHADESELVFLAGGIGITPIMSMLRYMRDAGDWKPSLLIYNNRTEEDIVFRLELDDMASASDTHLRVVHVLSKPATSDWSGERGHIDRAMLIKYAVGGNKSKGYYVCGPSAMTQETVTVLQSLDIPTDRIHIEVYSL